MSITAQRYTSLFGGIPWIQVKIHQWRPGCLDTHGERSDALRDCSAEVTAIFLIRPRTSPDISLSLLSRFALRFYFSGLLSMLPLVEGEAAPADRVLRRIWRIF